MARRWQGLAWLRLRVGRLGGSYSGKLPAVKSAGPGTFRRTTSYVLPSPRIARSSPREGRTTAFAFGTPPRGENSGGLMGIKVSCYHLLFHQTTGVWRKSK